MAPFTANLQAGDAWEPYEPGEKAPASGIYRCEHCNQEATVIRGHELPPRGHHVHSSPLSIRWRLVVKRNE
ncbi:hypothetical protein [Pseudomonas sp. KNUC1026]|uniref:hypothetical protein n=1 Tax=Pseudomonas sp. KNUC1026 TaxID=2893890 RepID=UPI001F490EFD|nr:hypothetical protein [Pseudomonas sp. KNUC1026]UFH51145.1 hypothetical protein LN139_08965 [Pseudomonas sp. KNUC1026]